MSIKQEIYAINDVPGDISLDGDFDITQAALFLGTLTEGPLTIKNYNSGKYTEATIEFLKSLGADIEKYESAVVVNYAEFPGESEFLNLSLDATPLSLSLAVGLIAGKHIGCTLQYRGEVNPDAVDELVMMLSKEGIEISHFDPAHVNSNDDYTGVIVFHPSQTTPIRRRFNNAVPYKKICLFMLGLASGHSITIEEEFVQPDWFEKLIANLNGRLEIRIAKLSWQTDPVDPRKRKRISDLDFARLIDLGPSNEFSGGELKLPPDTYEVMALLSWAVLKKKEITLPNVHIESRLIKFMDYLKSCGSECTVSNKNDLSGWPLGNIQFSGSKPKSKKLTENAARSLADSFALVGLLAAQAEGTTIIRNLQELNVWYNQPFAEVISNLGRSNIKGGVLDDGMIIESIHELNGDDFGPFNNRNVALAFYILALSGIGRSTIDNFHIIEDNYPRLLENLKEKVLKPAEVTGE